jgi:hypothetical protein
MSIAESNTEVAILSRAILPENGDLSVEAARAILAFKLDPRDQERVNNLAQRNQNDELTIDERQELDRYRHAGLVLDLMRSKARLTLRRSGKSSES